MQLQLHNVGPVRRDVAQRPLYLEPFRFRPTLEAGFDAPASMHGQPHPWSEEVQRAWWKTRMEAERMQHGFMALYEKLYRHRRGTDFQQARWKDPLIRQGEKIAERNVSLREEFDAFKHKVMGQLEVKDASDFGGSPVPRTVS